MKITSISAPSFRGDDAKINNDSFGKKQKKEKEKFEKVILDEYNKLLNEETNE